MNDTSTASGATSSATNSATSAPSAAATSTHAATASPPASVTDSSDTTGSGGAVAASENRPRTFAEALRAVEASDTSDPGATDPVPTTPAPATAAPVQAETDAPVVDHGTHAKGPIPFERHESILANTREKTAREIVSRVEQRYGGAIEFQQRLQSDPMGTVAQLVDEAVSAYGAPLVSHLARTLGARRKSQADLTPIDTDVGPVYTAEQVKSLVEQSIAARVAPLEQERERQARAMEADRKRAETSEMVRSRLSHWSKQPGFTEHESAIADAQAALVAQGVDTWSALGLAYASVVPPKLQAKQNTQLVHDAVRKAHASTGHPATVAPIQKPRPRTFREALEQAS